MPIVRTGRFAWKFAILDCILTIFYLDVIQCNPTGYKGKNVSFAKNTKQKGIPGRRIFAPSEGMSFKLF